MTELAISLFGPPQIVLDGAEVTINRRKAVALLAYLAATGQPHTRDALATLLWPETDQSRALAYLRTTLWTLNQALGDAWIDAGRDAVQLSAATLVRLDVAQFAVQRRTAAASSGADRVAALEAAAACYTDDFLAGFTLPDADPFNEWQYFEQERLRTELAALLDDLVHTYAGAGRFTEALPVALRRLALDPLHEDAYRQLMRLYAWAGQWSAAQRQYQQCVAMLRDELGADPDDTTRELADLIAARRLPLPPRTESESLPVERRATASPAPQAPAAATSPTSSPGAPELPAPGTPFVGRAHELDEIARLLDDPACRLLTLVGQGGIGKTRLALQTAADRAAAYRDGVVFVSLAPVRSAEYLLPALADALRFSGFERGDPQQQLLSYLHGKQMLLVMDNFEHLVEGADLLATILDGAPGVQVLATSRERLQLHGEWLYETRGLAFPVNGASGEHGSLLPDALVEYGAVQLFVSSARRVQPDFRLTDANAPAVTRICRLVEGMPLGVELAASWLQMLTPDAIADEIARSLDFLAAELRDLPARHRSVRAVFESSWERLSAAEQLVLARLSLFRGAFARAAATQVADASLPLLLALLNRSLLRRDGADSYSMHELLRQFAAEKLDADPADRVLTHGRYIAHYAAWLRVLEPGLKGDAQIDALNAVEAQIDNLRTAWLLAVERADNAALYALMNGLALFFQMRGRFQESHDMFGGTLHYLERQPPADAHPNPGAFDAALLAGLRVYWAQALSNLGQDRAAAEAQYQRVLPRLIDEPVTADMALVFYNLAMLAYWPAEEWAVAQDLCARVLAFFETAGDRWGIAQTLFLQGAVRHRLIEYDESSRLFEQSLALARDRGDFWGQANCLNMLGEVAFTHGYYPLAEDYYRQGLELNRSVGDRANAIWCMMRLADLLNIQGKFEDGGEMAAQTYRRARELGNKRQMAFALKQRGFAALYLGDAATAYRFFDESQVVLRQTDSTEHPAWFDVEMAELAVERGEADEAERLARATLPIFRAIDNGWGEAAAYAVLGSVARVRGHYTEARAHFVRALRIGQAHKSVMLLLRFLVGYARLLVDDGAPAHAVELLALVAAHHAAWQRDRIPAERELAALADALPRATFEAAQARGRASTLDDQLAAILAAEA